LNHLFRAVQKASPPSPESGFENGVMVAIRHEPQAHANTGLWFDELGALLPHLAWVTALAVALCAATDLGLGALGMPELADGVAQISEHWLFTATGF